MIYVNSCEYGKSLVIWLGGKETEVLRRYSATESII